MDLWKKKVVSNIKLLLVSKKAAVQAFNSFDESKAQISNEVEQKKDELQPKVIAIYESSLTEIKTLIKEPDVVGLKKHSTKVHKFLDELVAIDFPGSKAVCDAATKYGPVLVSGPIFFVFQKVSSFIVTQEKPTTITTTTREVEIPTPTPPPAEAEAEAEIIQAPPATTTSTPTKVEAKTTVVGNTVVVEPEKKDEAPPAKVEAGKPEEAPKAK